MTAFYIIKPDIFKDKEAMEYFITKISSNDKIKIKSYYFINDWIKASQILYEPSADFSEEEKRQIRMKMVRTLRGYKDIIKGNKGIVVVLDIPNQKEFLLEMEKIKKDIRKKYSYPKKMHFSKFINEQAIDFSKPLYDINIDEVRAEYIEADNDLSIPKEYQLVYLNALHFPDPEIDVLNNEYMELIKNGFVSENNDIKRMFSR